MKLGTGARWLRSNNGCVRALRGSPTRANLGTGARLFLCPERLKSDPERTADLLRSRRSVRIGGSLTSAPSDTTRLSPQDVTAQGHYLSDFTSVLVSTLLHSADTSGSSGAIQTTRGRNP